MWPHWTGLDFTVDKLSGQSATWYSGCVGAEILLTIEISCDCNLQQSTEYYNSSVSLAVFSELFGNLSLSSLIPPVILWNNKKKKK